MVLELPTGENIVNPTKADICEILERNSAYWLQGTGQAALIKNDVSKIYTALIFSFNPKYGYYVLDLDNYKAPLGNENDRSLLIAEDSGGDPFLIPLCCYLNHSQAKRILAHFLDYEEFIDYDEWYDIYEGQDESIEGNEIYNSITFGEILKITNGKVARV